MNKKKQNKIMAKKPRLLIYAHYYVPDVASTGQILRELSEGLLDTFEVTVICVVPSYTGFIEDNYKLNKFYRENIDGVNVLRIRVPEFSKQNKLSRVKNIVSYFIGAIVATFKVGAQDYVFSISQPPILGGLLGVWGKWVKSAKYIYNIQDFNPEQIMAVGYSKKKWVMKIMMWLDKFSCKRSDLVITVGRDLLDTLRQRFTGEQVPNTVMINNWIDEKTIYPLDSNDEKLVAFKKKYQLDDKFVIMYSGNLGLYYDLSNIMKVVRNFQPGTKTSDGREVIFAFIGDGSVKEEMISYKEKHNMENVKFIPYQNKEDLNYSLNAGDVHWCVNSKGIKGVSCPSKFYGIAACAKPVLGVLEKGSEIEMLISEIGCGLVTEPNEYERIEKNIRWYVEKAKEEDLINMGTKGREYLMQYLTKSMSIDKYRKAILED